MRKPAVCFLTGLLLGAGSTWLWRAPRARPEQHETGRAADGNRPRSPRLTIPPGAQITNLYPVSKYETEKTAPALRPRFDAVHRPTADDYALASFRHESEALYGPAIETMALAPNVAARLSELLAERLQAATDARQLAAGADTPVDPAAAVATAVGEVDAEVRALIGEPAFATLGYLMASPAYRDLKDSFLLDAKFADARLTSPQLVQLVRLMDSAPRRDPGQDSSAANEKELSASGLSPEDSSLYEQTGSFLRPDQRTLFNDYLHIRR